MNRPASVTPEVLVGIGALAAWLFGIVAQLPTIDMGLGTLIRDIGIVAVLIWYLYYHTTRTYPNMLKEFSLESEKMRTAFHAEQAAQRAAFETEQNANRVANEAEKAELRSMFVQALKEMRTAVHDVRDTAQVTMTTAKEAIQNKGAQGGST